MAYETLCHPKFDQFRFHLFQKLITGDGRDDHKISPEVLPDMSNSGAVKQERRDGDGGAVGGSHARNRFKHFNADLIPRGFMPLKVFI